MLTASQWNRFFIRYLLDCFVFFIPIFAISFIFSSGFVYMGENTSAVFSIIAKSQPEIIVFSILKVFLISLVICLGLQATSSTFKMKFKVVFGGLFFISAILRVCTLYPAIAENWSIIDEFESLRRSVQFLSTLPSNSQLRLVIQWGPFLVCFAAFFMNFFIHIRAMILQSKIVKKARNSISIDDLDFSSRVFSIQGVSFLIFILLGGVFLSYLTSSFAIALPQNNTAQSRPNVFIFAIDSLRYDRLKDSNFSNVMPFLRSKIEGATLFEPMLVGVPRTFPSWVEIATGNYSSKTSVRTMFPSRSSRMGKKDTIFRAAKENGYSTLFVSDFAGDIFPRYPFGATVMDAPTSNLYTLVENGMFVHLSAIQAVLILPNMQTIAPSILESAEIADPRLVAHSLASSLALVSHNPNPVFLTAFFSSAHFPYASPGPWYAQLQKKDSLGHFLFRKIPDQVAHAQTIGTSTEQLASLNKSQTIDLYDGGLNAIDTTLEKLFEELESKGWLNNSLIFIFGDHGENLYDGNMGMGHGDGVQGEFSNVTPLVIFTKGNVQPTTLQHHAIVRTIDIAPTIAKRINVPFNSSHTDGKPLLDKIDSPINFPTDAAYMESGIWFTRGKFSPENQPRIAYPGVAALLDIDSGMNFEFYLRPTYAQAIPGVKERAWINEKYRLVARTTRTGVKLSLYTRDDKTASHDLLATTSDVHKYSPIAFEMLNQMNTYLTSRGVEVVPNAKDSFFYSENISQ